MLANMLLDWVGLLVVVAGPCVLVLWAIVFLLTPFGPKSATRERLVSPMQACRDALGLAGDPDTALEASRGDQSVRIALEDPAKTQLPNLVLSVPQTSAGLNRRLPLTIDRIRPIVLRRETSEDRMGKLLFINRELQTGDEAFDASVYIETTAPFDVAAEALSDARVRKHVLELLEDGWTRVELYGLQPVRLEQEPTVEASLEPKRVERAIEHVIGLGQSLVPIAAERQELAKPSLRRRVLTGMMMSAWLVGVVLTIAGIRWWPPLTMTPFLWCSAAACVLFFFNIPWLALLVRGHSDSLSIMYRLLVWQIVGILPFCVGAGIVANGYLDRGPREDYEAQVIGIETTSKSSRFASYYLVTDAWLEGFETIYVPVSKETYLTVESNDQKRVSVTVGAGAWGWPWCEKVRVGPPQ